MSGATLALSLLTLATLSSSPDTPDMPDTRLEPCPGTPNCVSTQETRESRRMVPITYSGNIDQALQQLLDLLAEQPRVEVTEVGDQIVRAVFTTRLLRFKDDVVFLFEPEEQVIHFRSASRVGRSDLGANRERMERISKLYYDVSEAKSR